MGGCGGGLPEIGFIVDVGDFLDGFISRLICVEFFGYFTLCLLQFVEESGGDGQEVTACEFKDFACTTEGSACN